MSDDRDGIYIIRQEYSDDERFRAIYDSGRLLEVWETDKFGAKQFVRRFGDDEVVTTLLVDDGALTFTRAGNSRTLQVVDEDGKELFAHQLDCGPVADIDAFAATTRALLEPAIDHFDFDALTNSVEFHVDLDGMYSFDSTEEFLEYHADKLEGRDLGTVLASIDLVPWDDPMEMLDEFEPYPDDLVDRPARPQSVAGSASWNPETKQWIDTYDSPWETTLRVQFWDGEGEHQYFENRDKKTNERSEIHIYLDGANARLDFTAGRGSMTRFGSGTRFASHFPGSHAEFPPFPIDDEIEEMEFRFDPATADAEALQFEPQEVVFVAEDGYVDGEGNAVDPEWLRPEPEEPLEDGIYLGWHADDQVRFRVEVVDGEVATASEHDKEGKLVWERTYGDPGSLTVHGEDRTLSYERTGSSRRIRVTSNGGDVVHEAVLECGDVENAEAFVEQFESFYGALAAHFGIGFRNHFRVDVARFHAEHTELLRVDDVFEVTTLLGNGAGDYIIVIEEAGPHQGKVFEQYHEEGLYSVEDIAEFVEDEGLDDFEIDELIEEMPFFEYSVAKSLTRLLEMVDIVPWDDPVWNLDDLELQEG